MRKLQFILAFVVFLGASSFIVLKENTDPCADNPMNWGFYGHKRLNELAIYTLPEEMFGFYKANMNFLIEHSVDPDKRRYGVKGEAECHYIDMDRYCFDTLGCDPFTNVPMYWNDAVAKYSEDTLRAHGIVPWHVNLMVYKLTKAFEDGNLTRILHLSAELGHYIGDAHVPLHTTSNYNGQKTGQRGIHGFWESRIPELYDSNYDFFVGKAEYVKSPLKHIWGKVRQSYSAVDSVLSFERELNEKYTSDKKYSYEVRGMSQVKVYSEEYTNAYQQMLDGQVERRMKSAVITIGSFWMTAWINAGQPDLNKFIDSKEIITEENPDVIAEKQDTLRIRDHE
ncbi:MAG: zinc dependent phospholipase C family protein [Flavobacteriales bacterium]